MKNIAIGSFMLFGLACGSSSPNPLDDAGFDAGMTPPDSGAPPMSDASNGDAACSPPPFTDTFAAQRQACTFTAGAHVRDTLGLGDSARAAIPIKHIIVMMKENRAFDHMLGKLHDEGQPDAEAVPSSFSNVDKSSAVVAPFHEPTTCVSHDPDHQWTAMHNQVNGGNMDGFVTSAANTTGTDGHFVMGYYDQTDLPFYYWLTNTYAINDRHFASVRSGTFPDRNFLLLGTADGVQCTGCGYPDPSTPTIFDELDARGVTWGEFTGSTTPFEGTLNWPINHVGVHSIASFTSGLADGTLPAVSFIDSLESVQDEHPTADVQVGEAWTRGIYEQVVNSPLWPEMALIWTYDEAGGFADHVPPPNMACIARPIAKDQPYYELGVRVPLAVISPWVKPHYVSHVVQEHTAITRLIEATFDLPALTARDANSDALLDMFDFTCGPTLLAPPDAPAAGTGLCK